MTSSRSDAVAPDQIYSVIVEWLQKPTSGPISCFIMVFSGVVGLWLLGRRCHLPLQTRRWAWSLLLLLELWGMGWPRVAMPFEDEVGRGAGARFERDRCAARGVRPIDPRQRRENRRYGEHLRRGGRHEPSLSETQCYWGGGADAIASRDAR